MCTICIASIAVLGYFMYMKVSAQNQEMNKLSKRFEAIEMLFARPPPPDDLHDMYGTKYQHSSDHKTPILSQKSPCESAMCDLEPLRIDVNEDELENIVNAELSKVIEKEAATSPKRKQISKNSDE
jgi:hypothetical protein